MAEVLDLKEHTEGDEPKKLSPLEISDLGELETTGGRACVEVADYMSKSKVEPVSEKLDDYQVEHLKAVAMLTANEQPRGGVGPHLPDKTRAVGHRSLITGMQPTRERLNDLVQKGYLTKNLEGDRWELTEKGQEAVKG